MPDRRAEGVTIGGGTVEGTVAVDTAQLRASAAALATAFGMPHDLQADVLRQQLAEHRPMTATSYLTGRADTVDMHVYTVTKIDADGTVHLRNPWGVDGEGHADGDPHPKPLEITMTYEEFLRAFAYVDVGAVPG